MISSGLCTWKDHIAQRSGLAGSAITGIGRTPSAINVLSLLHLNSVTRRTSLNKQLTLSMPSSRLHYSDIQGRILSSQYFSISVGPFSGEFCSHGRKPILNCVNRGDRLSEHATHTAWTSLGTPVACQTLTSSSNIDISSSVRPSFTIFFAV
jgi:hypothetical protein